MSDQIVRDAEQAAASAKTLDDVRQTRAAFLGKKGSVSLLLKELAGLDAEARKTRGAELHALKTKIETIFAEREAALEQAALQERLAREQIDVTLPGQSPTPGSRHPLEATMRLILDVLGTMGFDIAEGPEVEDNFHNFDTLNFPADHPAKEMQDTFFLAPPHVDKHGAPLLLRTHTSPVQIRAMVGKQPPLRVAAPGKVYRCDADVTHSPMFHQVEGFWVDDRVTFRDLKGVLTELIQKIFGAEIPVRFRPSFFPFTEPSAEVDMGWKGGWLEVLGCGMIHPNVLRSAGIDPEKYQGFAFGLGVERFAMLRYEVPDIRLFYESDMRFLRQLSDRTVG